jgi:hypothetical protein
MEDLNGKKLPIGIEDFEKMIRSEYYYVDKTLFIKELLDNLAEVNLFLRPRRFGKTLALSMPRYFLEDAGSTGGGMMLGRDWRPAPCARP